MIQSNILAARTAIPPDIPRSLSALVSLLYDRCASQTFIVAVIPFSDVVCDLNLGFGADMVFFSRLLLLLPWQFVPAAKIKELQGSLSTFSRRYVSGYTR